MGRRRRGGAKAARRSPTAAAVLVAQMTEDERLWCLDGDIPFWAGHGRPRARAATTGGRSWPPRVERLGIPGFAFSDGPRGVVDRQRHLLPGDDGPGRHLGRRPRGAHRRGDRPRAPSGRRRPLRRRVRQRCSATPPGAAPRRPTARTRTTSARWAPPSPAASSATPWPRVKHFACNSMENARFKVDVTVDEQRAPRGVPPALQADRRRGRGLRDERLQRRQRRVVRREPPAAHRHPARRVGLRRLRHQRLDLRAARRRPHRSTAGLDVEMPARWSATQHLAAAHRAGRGRPTATSTASRRPARWPRCSATPPIPTGPTPCPTTCSRSPPTAPSPARPPPRSIVLLRNEPVDGTPLLPARPGDAPPRRRPRAGWPTCATSATAGRATCTPRRS